MKPSVINGRAARGAVSMNGNNGLLPAGLRFAARLAEDLRYRGLVREGTPSRKFHKFLGQEDAILYNAFNET